MRTLRFVAALALATSGAWAAAACAPSGPAGRSLPAGRPLPELPLGASPLVPVPPDNPLTEAKVELGRRLFFDAQLSRDSTVSCSSCHEPERSFSDGRTVARGIDDKEGTRNVPALINRAYGRSFFWDGRAHSLEEQALLPMVNPDEMGNTHEEILRRLGASGSYRRQFVGAFGADEITEERVAQAIASFVRTLVSGNSPFDRFEHLGDTAALSESARRGLALFRGRARCALCHTGGLFTDERFHNTGVTWRDGELLDSGRFVITGKNLHRGAFKTPTLRDVAQTEPYMHDGSFATLEEVVDFYDRGGNINPYQDPDIQPLDLTLQEKESLLAFLRSLSGEMRFGRAPLDRESAHK